jgi:hypothetical protein
MNTSVTNLMHPVADYTKHFRAMCSYQNLHTRKLLYNFDAKTGIAILSFQMHHPLYANDLTSAARPDLIDK